MASASSSVLASLYLGNGIELLLQDQLLALKPLASQKTPGGNQLVCSQPVNASCAPTQHDDTVSLSYKHISRARPPPYKSKETKSGSNIPQH